MTVSSIFVLPNLHHIVHALINKTNFSASKADAVLQNSTWYLFYCIALLKFKSNIWGVSINQSVSDEKNTLLACTDKLASQMKHSLLLTAFLGRDHFPFNTQTEL